MTVGVQIAQWSQKLSPDHTGIEKKTLVLCLNSTDKGWSSLPSVVTTSFFPGCLHLSLHHTILTGAMHVNLAFPCGKVPSIWWGGKQYKPISEWCHKLVSNARRLVNVTANWLEIQAKSWTIQRISEQLRKISDQFKTIDDKFHKSVSNSSKSMDNTTNRWPIWASWQTIPLIGISL